MLSVTSNYRKILSKNKNIFIAIVFFILFADVLFVDSISDLRFLFVFVIYSVLVYSFSLKSRVAFIICLYSLALTLCLLIFGAKGQYEKATSWFICFLIFGIVQVIISNRFYFFKKT